MVHPLDASPDREAFARLSRATFSAGAPVEAAAPRWLRNVLENPSFTPDQLRGAFLDGALVGGYVMFARTMRLGPARLSTGCIGTVVTTSEHRNRGVARAMMRDAIAHAEARRHALILLDGIAGFYHRFGYVDVHDVTSHHVALADVPPAPSPYAVRPATLDDADILLELYERHYGAYAGSFDRTAARQRHWLADRLPDNPPWLAADPAGRVRGYLLVPFSDPARGNEAGADDWSAALALLQHQAALVRAASPPLAASPAPAPELRWRLPPDSPTLQLLADHLPVESRTLHRPNADWMARPGHVPTLLEQSAPLWRDKLSLSFEDESFLATTAGAASHLTPAQLVQLLLGYRTPAALGLPSTLAALSPRVPFWIPGSDQF